MNYLMLGGDGKTYGPVTVEALGQWVKEGRMNARTQVAPEGTTEWKAASEWPELAALFVTVPPPCCCGGHDAGAAGASCCQPPVPGELRIGDYLKGSWELLKADPPLVIGGTAIFLLVMILLSLLRMPFSFIPVFGVIAAAVLGVVVAVVNSVFLGGLYGLFLKKIRGEAVGLEDVFAGFKVALVPLALTGLVIGLVALVCFAPCTCLSLLKQTGVVTGLLGDMLIGLCLLLGLIPVIYLSVCWMFAVPLVMDRKMAFWDGMELSRKTVNRQWFMFFLLFLVSSLVAVAGLLACCVGIFVSAPLSIGMIAYAYEDIFGKKHE